FTIIAHAHDWVSSGLDQDVATGFVSIERSSNRPLGEKFEWQALGDEVRIARLPFTLCNGVAIHLRISTFVHSIVCNSEQRREFPDTLVTDGFIAFERMARHITNERMQKHETGALLYAPEN